MINSLLQKIGQVDKWIFSKKTKIFSYENNKIIFLTEIILCLVVVNVYIAIKHGATMFAFSSVVTFLLLLFIGFFYVLYSVIKNRFNVNIAFILTFISMASSVLLLMMLLEIHKISILSATIYFISLLFCAFLMVYYMMSEVFMKFGSSIIFILLPFMFPLLVISLEYRHFFKSSPQPDIYYAIKTEDTQLLKKVLNQNNSYDDDINKALFNVMRSSHYTNKSQELEFLIKHGADVNKKNNGDTLVIALLHTEDNPDILKMLIDAGADVTITDNRNQTPLIVAYNYGRTKSIALLKSYKTEKNEYNETDLYEAAITENIENIKKITSYGISPNTKKINEKSPLATIIDIGDKPKVVQALLDVGADPRDMGYMGTPLMVTYIFGRKKSYDILKEYVSKTKDKNYKPQKSDLLEAATFGTPSEITKIVQSGVPVNFVINNSKETPLMYAAEYNPDPKVIEALIAAGADINAKTDMGYTAYYYARSSSKEIKNELLKAGANPDDVNIGRF